MKRIAVLLLVTVIGLAIFPACKKKKTESEEVALVVETNPANNANEATAPGPDFPLKVEIKSTMPPSGVKIEISANQDGSTATPFFLNSINSTNAQNNFSITNTPKGGIICVVDIKVTSLSKSSNMWKGRYTYARK